MSINPSYLEKFVVSTAKAALALTLHRKK